jgi:hypothetical protein
MRRRGLDLPAHPAALHVLATFMKQLAKLRVLRLNFAVEDADGKCPSPKSL